MFVDQACTIEAKDTFELTPVWGTYIGLFLACLLIVKLQLFSWHWIHTTLGDVIEVTQVEVGVAPILVVLLFFQHLCQPL